MEQNENEKRVHVNYVFDLEKRLWNYENDEKRVVRSYL
jgi:hypothetical protein